MSVDSSNFSSLKLYILLTLLSLIVVWLMYRAVRSPKIGNLDEVKTCLDCGEDSRNFGDSELCHLLQRINESIKSRIDIFVRLR